LVWWQVLDGLIHPHDGPSPTDSNFISRLTFGPASSLVCCRRPKKLKDDSNIEMKSKDKKTKKKATEGPLFEHSDLFRFDDDASHGVWKQFKPYWQAELTEKEYVSLHFSQYLVFLST
jgi:hypothetical protein